MTKKRFPWDCGDCPMLSTYDLSVDDLTYRCMWSKCQIDDYERYKSADCPMEKHDKEIRAKAVDECVDFVEEHSYLFNPYCESDAEPEEVFNLDYWRDEFEMLKEK